MLQILWWMFGLPAGCIGQMPYTSATACPCMCPERTCQEAWRVFSRYQCPLFALAAALLQNVSACLCLHVLAVVGSMTALIASHDAVGTVFHCCPLGSPGWILRALLAHSQSQQHFCCVRAAPDCAPLVNMVVLHMKAAAKDTGLGDMILVEERESRRQTGCMRMEWARCSCVSAC